MMFKNTLLSLFMIILSFGYSLPTQADTEQGNGLGGVNNASGNITVVNNSDVTITFFADKSYFSDGAAVTSGRTMVLAGKTGKITYNVDRGMHGEGKALADGKCEEKVDVETDIKYWTIIFDGHAKAWGKFSAEEACQASVSAAADVSYGFSPGAYFYLDMEAAAQDSNGRAIRYIGAYTMSVKSNTTLTHNAVFNKFVLYPGTQRTLECDIEGKVLPYLVSIASPVIKNKFGNMKDATLEFKGSMINPSLHCR